MKNLKKIASLLLALTLAIALAVPAMAAETKGSITINGIGAGGTYGIYKILDLSLGQKVDGSNGYTYSYELIGQPDAEGNWPEKTWADFFTKGAGKDYVTIKDERYIEWKTGKSGDADVAMFAQLALAYAKENEISPTASYKNESDASSHTFADLELGYYLVESTVGALCGLTTTDYNASITAKNVAPTITKQVVEDSTGETGPSNNADIGQIVEFHSTINVQKGAENYVIHDKMGEGFTFVGIQSLKHGTTQIPENYYTLNTEPADGCTFEIVFTKEFCEHVSTNDKILLQYTAKLNEKASIGENNGNPNETWMSYGEGHTTAHAITNTYTYQFQIVKTEESHKLIGGAEFKLYDAAEGGNEIPVVRVNDGVYRRAYTDAEIQNAATIVIEAVDGMATVKGFDNGTYYLEETKAPDGYNKLATRKAFTISDRDMNALFDGEVYSSDSGVHIVNKSGTMLPETGGMGTVLFVTFGMLVVLGTGVLLVTKKRMAMIED